MNIDIALRKVIRKSKRPVRDIALKSGVDYWTLWRWVKGRQPTLDHQVSEKVYLHLTGNGFAR